MKIFGNILPYVGLVVGPCDPDGLPAMTDQEVAAAHFETGALCIAWLGFAGLWPFGNIMPRKIDPDNPRRYAPGDDLGGAL